MNEVKHRVLETNGIRMHIAERGAGPLVIAFAHLFLAKLVAILFLLQHTRNYFA